MKKIFNVAFYLPQFYEFKENNEWWGKGFTEWTNVKKSKPLFRGHYQPTIPLNDNFYSLDDVDTMRWQVGIAKKYGVDGFCFYHYWFGNSRQLMEKPVDAFLKHGEIDFQFCLCWANHNWTRTWVGGDKEILMDMQYGDESEWQKHFNYLLPFFKDKRYIRIDDKPVLVIYRPSDIEKLDEMLEYLDKEAYKMGLNGIVFIGQHCFENRSKYKKINYFINYEPNFSLGAVRLNRLGFFTNPSYVANILYRKIRGLIKRITKGSLCKARWYNYDAVWRYSLKTQLKANNEIAGAFVHCDVSPRRQERAIIIRGDTPEKFKKYMIRLYKKLLNNDNLKYVFITAWNEWGEGMYLEPDEKNGYAYLEALCDAQKEVN